ncbi:MAG: hypothetical protein KDC45_07710, partial [Bacteroidetes bacterium]|nr:hypothetical protein [Bacteroidota bacterium]
MESLDFLGDAFLTNVRNDAELLAQTDAKFSKSESSRLSSILSAYYRRDLPFGIEAYKNMQDQPIETRMSIQKDVFWTAIGRFTPVLDFSEQERLKFARESDCDKLMVFLLFERDLEILDAVFNNPRLPTKVLLDYINLIKERDLDREDDKILKLAQQVMKRRSRRIIKAREIHDASAESLSDEQVLLLFSYLGDEDSLIVQAASNAISSMSVDTLKTYLKDESFAIRLRSRMPEMTGIQFFNSLKVAIRVVLAEKTHRNVLDPQKDGDVMANLNEEFYQCKLRHLEQCVEDPVDFFNLT